MSCAEYAAELVYLGAFTNVVLDLSGLLVTMSYNRCSLRVASCLMDCPCQRYYYRRVDTSARWNGCAKKGRTGIRQCRNKVVLSDPRPLDAEGNDDMELQMTITRHSLV